MTHQTRAPSGAPCRTPPASVIGTTPPPRPPPGTGRRAPSATSAASIPTIPLPVRPAPRPHHQRRRQRLPRRGRERPGRRRRDRRGGRLRPARRAMGPAGLRRLRPRRPPVVRRGGPAGRRLGPPRPVQAAQDLRRRHGPAPHGHREAHTTGRPRASRHCPARSGPSAGKTLPCPSPPSTPPPERRRRSSRPTRPKRSTPSSIAPWPPSPIPDDHLRRAVPPPADRGRAARGGGSRRGAHPHDRDGQDVRRGQGRGVQVRGRPALVRRQRRGAAGRRADRHHRVEVLCALPAARRRCWPSCRGTSRCGR